MFAEKNVMDMSGIGYQRRGRGLHQRHAYIINRYTSWSTTNQRDTVEELYSVTRRSSAKGEATLCDMSTLQSKWRSNPVPDPPFRYIVPDHAGQHINIDLSFLMKDGEEIVY